MRLEDCYQLGYVIKTHGLNGEIQIFLDVDQPAQYHELESMFIRQGSALIPFFFEYLQINGKKAIAKLEEIDSIDDAEKLVSQETYLPLSFLPDLSDGKYYYHQLVGLMVFHGEDTIGVVQEVYEQGPQVLISVDHQGTEILIPVNDEILTEVDLEKKEIQTQLPDGLLDVFLGDHED